MIPHGFLNIFDFVFEHIEHIYIHFKYHANKINYFFYIKWKMGEKTHILYIVFLLTGFSNGKIGLLKW